MSAEPRIIINDIGSPEIVPGELAVVIQQTGGAALVPGVEMLIITDTGPPGPPGAGDYTHPQLSPSTEWIVNHNKGLFPITSVRGVGGEEVEANVVHINNNQLRVYFESPFAGYVRCI